MKTKTPTDQIYRLHLKDVTVLDVRNHDFVVMVRRGAGSKEIRRVLEQLKRRSGFAGK